MLRRLLALREVYYPVRICTVAPPAGARAHDVINNRIQLPIRSCRDVQSNRVKSELQATPAALRLWIWTKNMQKRLSSNLRQTTRECTCLVRRGDFRLCDKNGGYNIWSAVAKNHHYRSPILVQIESPCDFLLVINTNLPSILHRFQVMADLYIYMSNFR